MKIQTKTIRYEEVIKEAASLDDLVADAIYLNPQLHTTWELIINGKGYRLRLERNTYGDAQG